MGRGLAIFAILLAGANIALAEDLNVVCSKKYKAIESGFDLYNEKCAVANGVMERINTYAKVEVDITTIKTRDARLLRAAIQQSIPVGQLMLQTLAEYDAMCSAGGVQKHQLNKMVDKLKIDLRGAQARIDALNSGFPEATFK